jgi:PST family polysaccharide transporter
MRRRLADLRRSLASPLLRDTLRLQAGQVLLVGIHAARALLALRWLGPLAFGTYALAQSIVTAALLADVTAAGRVALIGAAQALGKERRGDAAAPLADFLRLATAAGIVLAGALWFLAPSLTALAYREAGVGDWAGWLGVTLLTDVPFSLLVVALQAARRTAALVVAETLRAGAWLVVTVAALLLSDSVAALVSAQLVVSVLASIVAALAYARLARSEPRLPGWAELLRQAARRSSRPALATGARIAVDKNLGNLAAQLPLLLLGAFDTAAVGQLAAAMRVMGLPGPLLTGVARNLDAVLPAQAAASREQVRQTFLASTRVVALAWVLVTAVTALLAPLVLLRLLGPAYAPALALIPALAVGSVVLGGGVAMGAVFRTLDRVGRSIVCQATALAVTMPIGLLLIGRGGAAGAAWFHALRVAVVTALSLAAVVHLLRPSHGAPTDQA